MAKLCTCPRLDLLSPGITTGGGITCVWNPTDAKNATLDMVMNAGTNCGGSVDEIQTATMAFNSNGCGRLRISLTGPGSAWLEYPTLYVNVRGSGVGNWHGSGGMNEGCTMGSMIQTLGSDPIEVDLCCGVAVEMGLSHVNTKTPELDLSLVFEVF